MKKLLFCVPIFTSLFDSFPHCVYRFSKIQSAKSISQQVLNYRKFLLISGSSREISKESDCRYYCSHWEFWQEGNSEVSQGLGLAMIIHVIISFLKVIWWDFQRDSKFSWNWKKGENIYWHFTRSCCLPVIILHSWHSSACLAIINLFFKWSNWDLEGIRKRLRSIMICDARVPFSHHSTC